MGIFSPETLSVGDLFIGALFPGLLLVALYIIYLLLVAWLKPHSMPAIPAEERGDTAQLKAQVMRELLPPLLLIFVVLGSIISGLATPTEAAAVGAVGALLLAILRQQFKLAMLREVMQSTTRVSSMVFMIFIGASIFSLVFRGFDGDTMVENYLSELPGGMYGALLLVMLVMFLLGFVLDFIEITFVVVPIVGPILLTMGIDPIWLGILIAINLQTSFLTPPFGFALFYLRGVAAQQVSTMDIYRGVIPFIMIQLLALAMIAYWPAIATWLPQQLMN
jgi:tripartite ATP-independent transporter DctM subunit